MSSRSAAVRAAGSLVAVLLLLGGCTTDGAGGIEAGPRALATASSSPAPPGGSPSAPLPARAPRSSAEPSTPPVPQYRATLRAARKDGPAPADFAAGTIGVRLPVVPTGVATDGRMQLPETNREVAWYEYGSRPGDPEGTTVLAAHVDTRAEGLGPFARLRELRRGDALTVTDASGRPHDYTVTAVDDVKKSDISLDQLFRRDGAPELKVLTCGGPYSRATGYRDNIVVSARPA